MSVKDYYKVLGVPRDASINEIKKAYKQLAMRHHPDRNPDDSQAENVFKEISEAYTVLGDPQKRKEYDMGPQTYVGGHGFDGFTTGFSVNMGGGGFGDIFSHFEEIFGTGRRRQTQRRSRRPANLDIDAVLNLSFEEAVLGCTQTLTLERKKACGSCEGTGNRGGKTSRCANCDGSGIATQRQGHIKISSTCGVCGGSGRVIIDTCLNCSGDGMMLETETLDVRIPAGVDSGDCLKLSQKGDHMNLHISPGDVNLHLRVGDSSCFQRKGNDIYSVEHVDITLLMLGGKLSAQTIHGKKTMEIPAGMQVDSEFKACGAGVHTHRGQKGDHYITFKLQIPTSLNSEQKEAFKKFSEMLKP